MKTTKEMIEVMTAYDNGAEIECCEIGKTMGWSKYKYPSFSWGFFDYRIKEQKKHVTIEKWLCEYDRCEKLQGSKRFFILEKIVPFEFGNGKKVKLLDTYEVEL